MTLKELFELKFKEWLTKQAKRDIKFWETIASENNLSFKEFVYQNLLDFTYEDVKKYNLDLYYFKDNKLIKTYRQNMVMINIF